MPQIVSLKFSQEEMPKNYDPAGIGDLSLQDFVIAEREDGQDVGFVSAIEWVSSEQLHLRRHPMKRVVRRASDEEKEAFFQRKTDERRALVLCKEKARELNLPMKISTSRIDPSDGRIIFQFTSDQRVDFRQLVRELSLILRTRIELWQIGVRDEAKALDGFGICGLRTCCSSWIDDFRPINIRMAKDQDINLPPSKLSGQCGRLLCCLSYEVDQYREMSKELLTKGATINVEGRDGIIIDRNVIMRTYLVKYPDGPLQTITADQVQNIRVPDQMKRMGKVLRETKALEEDPPAPPKAEAVTAPESVEEKDDTTPKRSRRRRRSKSGKTGETGAIPAIAKPPAAPPTKESDNTETDEDKAAGRRRKRRRKPKSAKPGGVEKSSTSPEHDSAPPPKAAKSEDGDKDAGGANAGRRKRRRSRGRRKPSGGES